MLRVVACQWTSTLRLITRRRYHSQTPPLLPCAPPCSDWQAMHQVSDSWLEQPHLQKTQVNVQDSRHSHLQQPVQTQQIPTRTKSISAPAKSGGLAFRCQCNGRGGVGPCLGKFSLELPNFRRRSALRRCLRLRRWFSLGRGLAKRSLSTAAP